MNRGKEKRPRRLREREGQLGPRADRISQLAPASKPFDAVEKKLSLTLDALLNAIDTYRELGR